MTHDEIVSMAAHALVEVDSDIPTTQAMTVLRVAEPIIRDEERERIALAWQIKEWPLLTQYFKTGNVLGAAQAVTDWLRRA